MGAAASIPLEANEQQLIEVYGAEIVSPYLLEYLRGADGLVSRDVLTSLHGMHGESDDPVIGIVIALSKAISDQKDSEKKGLASDALSFVLERCGAQIGRQILQQSISHLVTGLTDKDNAADSSNAMNHSVLRCILCEVVQPSITDYATTTDLGLLEKVVVALRSNPTNDNELRATAIEILVAVFGISPSDNSSLDSIMSRLCSPHLGAIYALVRIIQHEVVDFVRYRCIAALWNLSEKNHTVASTSIILNGGHIALLNVIKEAGPNCFMWMMPNHSSGECPASYALNCLVNLSRCSNTIDAIKRSRALDIIRPLRNAVGSIQSLKALLLAAFLIGRDVVTDVTDGESMLKMQVEDVDLLVEVMVNTLESRGGKDYTVGVFSIKTLLDATLCLASRALNRSLLTRSPLMHYVVITLRRFVDFCVSDADAVTPNTAAGVPVAKADDVVITVEPPPLAVGVPFDVGDDENKYTSSSSTVLSKYRCDGSCHDPDTARLAVDLLSVLAPSESTTLCDDDNDPLKEVSRLFHPSLGVDELLQQYADLPLEVGGGVSDDSRQCAVTLLDRLKRRSDLGGGDTVAGGGTVGGGTEGGGGAGRLFHNRSGSAATASTASLASRVRLPSTTAVLGAYEKNKTSNGGGVGASVTVAHINPDSEKDKEGSSVKSETDEAKKDSKSRDDGKLAATTTAGTETSTKEEASHGDAPPNGNTKAASVTTLPSSQSFSTARLASSTRLAALPNVDRGQYQHQQQQQQQHVLVSYTWPARKDLVNNLCWHMRSMGYNVWRDAEGTAFFNFLSGATDVILSDIVLGSYCIIVCVSPEYKKLGHDLLDADNTEETQFFVEMSSGLRIIFVIMNEGYHMTSSPYSIDGWLKAIIEGSDWHPLWEESNVLLTATAISRQIGDHAKKQQQHGNEKDIDVSQNNQSSSPFHTTRTPQSSLLSMSQSSMMLGGGFYRSANTSSSSTALLGGRRMKSEYSPERPQDTDFILSSSSNDGLTLYNKPPIKPRNPTRSSSDNAIGNWGVSMDRHINTNLSPREYLASAWSLLMNPTKETDPKGLHTLLDQLGVSDPEELSQCTGQELYQVAAFMKPVPKRAFEDFMKKAMMLP